MKDLYDTDFYSWSKQTDALREGGRSGGIDCESYSRSNLSSLSNLALMRCKVMLNRGLMYGSS
jgi:hypothetical protein